MLWFNCVNFNFITPWSTYVLKYEVDTKQVMKIEKSKPTIWSFKNNDQRNWILAAVHLAGNMAVVYILQLANKWSFPHHD